MKEFNIDDKVTIDRYNHITDVQKGIIVGYGSMSISGTLTYKVNINDVIIQTTGISIMESKDYVPVNDNERHQPFSIAREIELSIRK